MATFQTNKETQASLENIISNAEKQLILVSPYIKLTSALFTRLKSCCERGVTIKIMFRTGELKDEKVSSLATHKNVELRSADDLHAKCYFNEREMIVTSLNLLESSEKNWEMGVLIDSINDKIMFDKAKREVNTIFDGSKPHSTSPTQVNSQKHIKPNAAAKLNSNDGYCIRCEAKIPFNKDKAMCYTCYTLWKEWENEEYPEKYCHFSGEDAKGETCFARPILKENWKEAKRIHCF